MVEETYSLNLWGYVCLRKTLDKHTFKKFGFVDDQLIEKPLNETYGFAESIIIDSTCKVIYRSEQVITDWKFTKIVLEHMEKKNKVNSITSGKKQKNLSEFQ